MASAIVFRGSLKMGSFKLRGRVGAKGAQRNSDCVKPQSAVDLVELRC